MSIRSPDEALSSEPCFEASLQEFSLFTNQTVNIAKWSEDVTGAASFDSEFLFSTPEFDMAYEPKHDNASVHSMDSAYQSQASAGRRGNTRPDGYQQDNRSRMSGNFMGGHIYSPTLSSDTLGAFQDQQSDMSHMQLPTAGGELDGGDNTFAYANYTTGQDFSQYTATSTPRYTPATNLDMASQWGLYDTQAFAAPFNFTTYSKSAQNLDNALYSSQDASDMMFTEPTHAQRQMSKPRLNTSVRPSALRNTSYNSAQSLRQTSSQDAGFGSYVMSPSSVISGHLPIGVTEFEQQQSLDAKIENEETASASFATQSIHDDEDDLLSPSDAAEAKTMEEEQGKLARSHPLYQAQPDDAGKYHCPHEGKAGCTHKPTPLKCNYDKYVDSHLKPFRCNKKVCIGVQFSSTACLLRHEREAHGMHGHGSRPHLCHFTDCERSVPGNGFPRRYNLFDHMKRVHDFTGPTTEPSPPASQAQTSTRKTSSRKRKSGGDEPREKRQKVVKPSPEQQLQQLRAQLQEEFMSKKQNIMDILTNLGGPKDLDDDLQLTKEVICLHEISTKFKKSIGG